MRILTPELWCHSCMSADNDAAELETREIDLALARRSAIVINAIEGYIGCGIGVTSGLLDELAIVQELDLDPDNVDVWLSAARLLDDVEVDSSRVFRQRYVAHADTAAGTTLSPNSNKNVNWYHSPLNDRPITTRNLRHHYEAVAVDVINIEVELTIRYFIVELSLEELGYINASRR